MATAQKDLSITVADRPMHVTGPWLPSQGGSIMVDDQGHPLLGADDLCCTGCLWENMPNSVIVKNLSTGIYGPDPWGNPTCDIGAILGEEFSLPGYTTLAGKYYFLRKTVGSLIVHAYLGMSWGLDGTPNPHVPAVRSWYSAMFGANLYYHWTFEVGLGQFIAYSPGALWVKNAWLTPADGPCGTYLRTADLPSCSHVPLNILRSGNPYSLVPPHDPCPQYCAAPAKAIVIKAGN